MLSAYPTRSLRHSKGIFARWMLGLPLIVVAAGLIAGSGNINNVRSITTFLPSVSDVSGQIQEPRAAPLSRPPSFRISGPAAAGIAVLMNDSPELRALAKQVRIEHASEQLPDDPKLEP
ncbi:MAG: hypothetical protein ACPGRZ_18105 [Alphaproteobacteria bacterium]